MYDFLNKLSNFSRFQSNLQISSECGEAFCGSCWDEYLSAKLTDQANLQMIQCPGCDIVMDDRAILKVLSKDSKLKVRYQQVLINSFVECNNLLKWCPSPNCENVIKVPHVEAKTVTCSCGHSFCFVCVKDQHDPVRKSYFIWLSSKNLKFFSFSLQICCPYLKKWLKKCIDDSETSNWIKANTKDCPKCETAIEKNGGCNHITCTKTSCGYEFCWKCMGPWLKHGYSGW